MSAHKNSFCNLFLTRNTKSDYLSVIQFDKLSCKVILHTKTVVTTRYRMKLSTNKNNWSTFTQDFEAGKFHVLAHHSQLLSYRTYSEMECQRVFVLEELPCGQVFLPEFLTSAKAISKQARRLTPKYRKRNCACSSTGGQTVLHTTDIYVKHNIRTFFPIYLCLSPNMQTIYNYADHSEILPQWGPLCV